MNEEQIERECVEYVFNLTGGDLNDAPWKAFTQRDLSGEALTYAYTYDGAPDYADEARDFKSTYKTVVSCCLFGEEPEYLFTKGACYKRVAQFTSSGECECPLEESIHDGMQELMAKRPCPYCEAQEGEEHGCIYLGDGWCETVYLEVSTCETCGTDLTSHCDYGDDRCLACEPYAFTVEASGASSYGGTDLVYEGSDPTVAESVFATWAARCDTVLQLDGTMIREESVYSREKAIRTAGLDVLTCAEVFGWDSPKIRDLLRKVYARYGRPSDGQAAQAWVEGRLSLLTSDGPLGQIEWRIFYEGVWVQSKSDKVPWSKCIGVHVWKRTGKVWFWGDEERQLEIASINADFAAQYEAWKKSNAAA